MPIPQFGPFKQSGSATNTTIQGGTIEGGSSAQQSDDFIELRSESTASLFDTQFSGDVSNPVNDISSSLQWRNYPSSSADKSFSLACKFAPPVSVSPTPTPSPAVGAISKCLSSLKSSTGVLQYAFVNGGTADIGGGLLWPPNTSYAVHSITYTEDTSDTDLQILIASSGNDPGQFEKLNISSSAGSFDFHYYQLRTNEASGNNWLYHWTGSNPFPPDLTLDPCVKFTVTGTAPLPTPTATGTYCYNATRFHYIRQDVCNDNATAQQICLASIPCAPGDQLYSDFARLNPLIPPTLQRYVAVDDNIDSIFNKLLTVDASGIIIATSSCDGFRVTVTPTPTPAELTYNCGEGYKTQGTGSYNYGVYPIFTIDGDDPSNENTIYIQPYERPNRITILDDSGTITSSGWLGYAAPQYGLSYNAYDGFQGQGGWDTTTGFNRQGTTQIKFNWGSAGGRKVVAEYANFNPDDPLGDAVVWQIVCGTPTPTPTPTRSPVPPSPTPSPSPVVSSNGSVTYRYTSTSGNSGINSICYNSSLSSGTATVTAPVTEARAAQAASDDLGTGYFIKLVSITDGDGNAVGITSATYWDNFSQITVQGPHTCATRTPTPTPSPAGVTVTPTPSPLSYCAQQNYNSSNGISLNLDTTQYGACYSNNFVATRYMSSATWITTSCLSSVNGSYSAPIAGFYSDGNYVRYWNGSSLGSFTACNTLSSPTPTPTPTPSPSPTGLYCSSTCKQYTLFGGTSGDETYFIYTECQNGQVTTADVNNYDTTVICACSSPFKPPQSGNGTVSGGFTPCSGGIP